MVVVRHSQGRGHTGEARFLDRATAEEWAVKYRPGWVVQETTPAEEIRWEYDVPDGADPVAWLRARFDGIAAWFATIPDNDVFFAEREYCAARRAWSLLRSVGAVEGECPDFARLSATGCGEATLRAARAGGRLA